MILSIIIPIFNEEKTIEEILERVTKVKLPYSVRKKIIVVDDGSSDNSKSKIQNSKFYKNIKLVVHKNNQGKGAAIRTGLKYIIGDFVIIQDADLEYNPNDYPKLLKPIVEKQAEVVFGTRLKNYPLKLWGPHKTPLPLHLIANKFLTLLTNMLYGSNMTDMETGYKLFRKEVLKSIELNCNKFNFEAEVTAKLLKRKITVIEVPISVKPRTYQEGKKIGWQDGFSAIRTLVRYRFL